MRSDFPLNSYACRILNSSVKYCCFRVGSGCNSVGLCICYSLLGDSSPKFSFVSGQVFKEKSVAPTSTGVVIFIDETMKRWS